MQIKLLRVLQENMLVRIGGKMVIPLDIRIISASGNNLENLVRDGSFRLDLYFRLNTIVINIPSLRDRKDDIILLAEHFKI